MNDNSKELHNVRKDYIRHELADSDLLPSPFLMLQRWLDDAKGLDPEEYNAMTLSTMSEVGYPHSRVVLLRYFDTHGLVFYTNYLSNKGRELDLNAKVCVNFYWRDLERQVRVYGEARKVSAAESDAYFKTRPRESQIGSWASPQSSVIQNRSELDVRVSEAMSRFEGKEVPRPEYWGGYRIVPHYFEFWQGRPSRLHDRIVFRVDADFQWFRERLAP
jgi:pyridoxamine 5'-phosphate oxidase